VGSCVGVAWWVPSRSSAGWWGRAGARRRPASAASDREGEEVRWGRSGAGSRRPGRPDGARRLEANLYKLVNVLRVDDLTVRPSVERDLAMIKVAATPETRTHIMQLVDVFRARMIDVAPDSVIIETTGTEDKIDGLIEVLKQYGVIEMVRTGRVAMARGPKVGGLGDGAEHGTKVADEVSADDSNVSYSV